MARTSRKEVPRAWVVLRDTERKSQESGCTGIVQADGIEGGGARCSFTYCPSLLRARPSLERLRGALDRVQSGQGASKPDTKRMARTTRKAAARDRGMPKLDGSGKRGDRLSKPSAAEVQRNEFIRAAERTAWIAALNEIDKQAVEPLFRQWYVLKK
jgi:hypothetical protein